MLTAAEQQELNQLEQEFGAQSNLTPDEAQELSSLEAEFGLAPTQLALDSTATPEDLQKYRDMGVKQYRSPEGKLYDLTTPSSKPSIIGGGGQFKGTGATGTWEYDEHERKVQYVMDMISKAKPVDQAYMLGVLPFTNPLNISSWLSTKGIETPKGANENITEQQKGTMTAFYEAIDRYSSDLKLTDPRKWASIAGRIAKLAIEFKGAPGKSVAKKFATHELMTLPTRREAEMSLPKYAVEKAQRTAESFLTGYGVGLAGKYIPKSYLRIPAVTSGFMGITALRGGSPEEILETGVTVLGFEALGFMQKSVKSSATKTQNLWATKAVKAARAHNKELWKYTNSEVANILRLQAENMKQMGIEKAADLKKRHAMATKARRDSVERARLIAERGIKKPTPAVKEPATRPIAGPTRAVAGQTPIKGGVVGGKPLKTAPIASQEKGLPKLTENEEAVISDKSIPIRDIVSEEYHPKFRALMNKHEIEFIKNNPFGIVGWNKQSEDTDLVKHIKSTPGYQLLQGEEIPGYGSFSGTTLHKLTYDSPNGRKYAWVIYARPDIDSFTEESIITTKSITPDEFERAYNILHEYDAIHPLGEDTSETSGTERFLTKFKKITKGLEKSYGEHWGQLTGDLDWNRDKALAFWKLFKGILSEDEFVEKYGYGLELPSYYWPSALRNNKLVTPDTYKNATDLEKQFYDALSDQKPLVLSDGSVLDRGGRKEYRIPDEAKLREVLPLMKNIGRNIDKFVKNYITSAGSTLAEDTLREAGIELPAAEAKPAEALAKLDAKAAEIIKPEGTPEQQKSRLRQKIGAVAATRGLTQKLQKELKTKYTGYKSISSPKAKKNITVEQLNSLLKATLAARPKRIGSQKVLTPKQETKISSLKDNLIKMGQLTEVDYADILRKETGGREAKYTDARNFITQAEAANVIKRIHNQSEITRIVESDELAIRSKPEIAKEVTGIDTKITNKRNKMKRDPWQFESMRYYAEQMELKTGAPFYPVYNELNKIHLESGKTRTARMMELGEGISTFKQIASNNDALQRVSDYIVSQSNLENKPAVPENITEDEVELAKRIQQIFRDYEPKARWAKFYWWYVTGKQNGPYPIGDYEANKKAISRAVDIYESKGKDAVIEYLKTQKWGIIKSGYEPLDTVLLKIRLYKIRPTTVGKSHVQVRTGIEYHSQERTILQRLGAYMRQIDMLYDMSPKINAMIQLFEDNQEKFNNPARIKESLENYIQTIKRYNSEGGFWGRAMARIYAQAMRSVITVKPVLAFRNLFQNLAFEHDKTILIDPRNKTLTPEDIQYLETYVQQQRAMIEEYFMMGEKPLPGLKTISKLAEKVKIYPASDMANRYWSFWAKINQVRRALESGSIREMMEKAKFDDMTDFEQKKALAILAKDGPDAMARFVAAAHVADIHFLYERSQRAPVEMGSNLARVYGNLMLFPRAYGEKLTRMANKMIRGQTPTERWRGLKVLMSVIAGGLIAGAVYQKITGRKRNPYNPLAILSWQPGGLAQGAIEEVGTAYSNVLMAVNGDKKALATFLNTLPAMADMFIPFYDMALQGIEALTDQKNIDYKAVRQIRSAIDKEYKVRGGAYKVKRTTLERWQYFIGGAGVDQKGKKKLSLPVTSKVIE